MKKLFIVLMLLSTLLLSACNESYPSVIINDSIKSDSRRISIGQPYKYDGFNISDTDSGKDLVLHFIKREQE